MDQITSHAYEPVSTHSHHITKQVPLHGGALTSHGGAMTGVRGIM
jgi:hypothetical protein